MKTSKSYYFPAEDSRTSRLELMAFSALGLAGAVLIATAITDSLRFAQNRDAIIQACSATGAELARQTSGQTPTNGLHVHVVTAETHQQTSSGAPASEARATRIPQYLSIMEEAMH